MIRVPPYRRELINPKGVNRPPPRRSPSRGSRPFHMGGCLADAAQWTADPAAVEGDGLMTEVEAHKRSDNRIVTAPLESGWFHCRARSHMITGRGSELGGCSDGAAQSSSGGLELWGGIWRDMAKEGSILGTWISTAKPQMTEAHLRLAKGMVDEDECLQGGVFREGARLEGREEERARRDGGREKRGMMEVQEQEAMLPLAVFIWRLCSPAIAEFVEGL
ncbi:hypothetical protein C8R47DRAFT_1195252 [Mycena vitilis]|nr:hypothetical protein C8R47DRAFT_1195252 [Mycena vitilis]